MLQKHGYHPQRLNSTTLKNRFPAWNAEKYSDGYFNPRAGWGESAKVVQRLVREARAEGVSIWENLAVLRLIEDGKRITGVVTSDGERSKADIIVLATGTWSPLLSSRLSDMITHVAQPIFYFRPEQADLYQRKYFPVWAADLSKTGWYGFPATKDGVVKVSNYGPGRKVHPDDKRQTAPEDERWCRSFLRENLPSLANAPLANSRTCLHCDSWDGNFYIDHDPERPGLVYATGGSGHAFKFTPVLGRLVADVIERTPNSYAGRFAWRPRGTVSVKEQARYQGQWVEQTKSSY
jgi:sarcosine oxidase/L-pipecolate oxidase